MSTRGRKKGNISFGLALAIIDGGVSLKDLRTAYEGNSPEFAAMVKQGKKMLTGGKPGSASKPGRPIDERTMAGLKAMRVNVAKLPAEGTAERRAILTRARNVGKAIASQSAIQPTA